MENYTLSRTTTEGSAHLGASDILKGYPQTHARAQGECKTTTERHVKLLWVMLFGNHWEKNKLEATVNPVFGEATCQLLDWNRVKMFVTV